MLAALREQFEYDAPRDLRRRRLLPARLPGRDRHRQARQGVPRPPDTASAPSGSPCGSRSAGTAVESGARSGLRFGDAIASASPTRRSVASPRRCARPSAASWFRRGAIRCRRRHPRRCRRPPRGRRRGLHARPASTGSSGRRRASARRRAEPARGAGRGLGAGRPAGVDPRGRHRELLFDPVGVEGLSQRRTSSPPTGRSRALWRWTDEGTLPIVIDASSCTLGLAESDPDLTEQNRERHAELEIHDSISWAQGSLLPRLEVKRKLDSALVHPTCSVRHLGLARRSPSSSASSPRMSWCRSSASCCGFAGDRGFLHPELTESATRAEAAEIQARDCDAHLASNRTCEVGLSRPAASSSSRSSTCSKS